MHYDQSWMGYGLIGGLQAGAISLAVGVALYLIVHAIGQRAGWSVAVQVTVALLLTLFLTASGDFWDLLYFNYAQLQSLQLLKAKLAEVHDPDNIGGRVFWELIGALAGVLGTWLIRTGSWRQIWDVEK